MDEEAGTTTAVVHVTYHQLPLAAENIFPNDHTGGGNGLGM